MIYPKIPLAQSVIEICKQQGIQHIVISPGSRNAPLTIGFSNNVNFTCYSIVDERCAAFFAMGIAQQIQQPVAVICTSGSAVLNYYPAVGEAFYSQIPLVVISADRPHNKIDIGDGQTIRQENVFANHILFNANLTEETSEKNDELINKALLTSIHQRGPVHINVPFEEPLYETQDFISVKPKILKEQKENFNFQLENEHVDFWNMTDKKMILIGELFPNSIDENIISALAKDKSIVVFTEKNSNVHHPSFVNNIDTIITPFTSEDFKNFQPELLVTLGGMVVSKRIKAFLRKYKPKQHWHVDVLRAYDTYEALTHHFKVNPNNFFEEMLLQAKSIKSDYNESIHLIKRQRALRYSQFIEKVTYSDFKVFDKIAQLLPKNIQLQVSNSSAIRYMQLVTIDKSIEIFCNRGTSGIDGSTSTAIGAALVSNKPTVLVTGDISFFYDSNALWNNYIPQNFKIILVNNSGGGIFRILPGHQESETFTKFFETSHHLTAEHLSRMYGFEYKAVRNDDELNVEMPLFIKRNSKPQLLEIFTPEKTNDKVLKDFFNKLL